jgi:hypothetical protein
MRGYTLGVIAVLILGGRSVEAQVCSCGSNPSCSVLFQNTSRSLFCALFGQVFQHLEKTFLFVPLADGGDGGGDGGGGDGGGGDGGDGGAGATGDGDSGDSDGPSGDTGSVGDPGDQGDQGNTDNSAPSDPSTVSDPTTDPANENAALSPTAPTATVDTTQTSPNFGPGSPGGAGANTGVISRIEPGGVIPSQLPGGSVPGGAGLDVSINAVIVSGAPTPWEAIGKVPGVRNVLMTGGIVALGEAPLANPLADVTVGSPFIPPSWLKFKPDLRYLNGSIFPPVVPNVIDIRIISYTQEVIENPRN